VLHFSRTEEDRLALLVRGDLHLEQRWVDALATLHRVTEDLFDGLERELGLPRRDTRGIRDRVLEPRRRKHRQPHAVERRNESLYVAPLLDSLHARGFQPKTCAMDKGYDNNRVMDETRERNCVPIVCPRKGRPSPLTPIPYGSDEWKRFYRGRAAVEREFGRLKNEYALTPLRTRGLDRVRLHTDLVLMARLGQALARARELPLAALLKLA
jgi:hypothetical protein